MTDHGPKPYVVDIEKATLENDNYRTTLWTGAHLQLTVMSIQPGHDIGLEVHDDHDQFFRIEKGKGEVWIDGVRTKIKGDHAIIVPAGARHNVINTGEKSLKLYTLYAPPEHRDGVVRATKAQAEAGEEHFDGVLTEDGPGTKI